MKIGKQEVDNNLVFLLAALVAYYFLFNKITSTIGGIFGENEEDKKKREAAEAVINITAPVFSKTWFNQLNKKYGKAVVDKKGSAISAALRKKYVTTLNDALRGYTSDADAAKVLGVFQRMPNKLQVYQLAYAYQNVTGKDLLADIKNSLDDDDNLQLADILQRLPEL